MNCVNSFDIFDTLLARDVYNPTDIFNIIECEYPYKNFKSLRITAQSMANQLIDDIYNKFKEITGETDETIQKLKSYELLIEKQHTIPIMSNILKINDGDILVSDMYLTHSNIMELLDYHGINKKITLYVSSGGKSNGSIWKELNTKYKILNHTGDNMHSDIKMANMHNINTTYTNIHKFTHLEESLLYNNKELGALLRKFRLLNPYSENSTEYTIYEQQIEYNIPLLLFMCRQLNDILIKENRTTVLFLSRDGCLIINLFKFLYPQFNSIYFHSSRRINNSYSEEYCNYVRSIYNKDTCILFDLHGSFNSGRKLFMHLFNELPRIFIFDISILSNKYNNMTYITNKSNVIEELNQDIVGTLCKYEDGIDIRFPPEYNRSFSSIMHKTINMFISYINTNVLLDCILKNNIFNDIIFWTNYYSHVIHNIKRILPNQNEPRSLTELANKYNSDKGNTYKCAHHYTLAYESIINRIININGIEKIELLEIGLNRDNQDSIPSMQLWNDYFNNNCTLTGFDIEPSFKKFNGKYKNIVIKIGDQSNVNDLFQLTDKQYDIIIDDGYHASMHQQISFKTLWNNVKKGGYYIIEDLHYQPINENCIKTRDLFKNILSVKNYNTEYINKNEISAIISEIDTIEFYDSKSSQWGNSVKDALVVIKKCF